MPARTDGGAVTLDARDAAIMTATITIKALQVGKKQMTQSVFKQLPVAPLVDEATPSLVAEPWGWVNYCPKDEDSKATQFVFQRGPVLYRSAFRIRMSDEFRGRGNGPPPYLALRDAWELCVKPLHCARILEGWHPGNDKAAISHENWSGYYKSAMFGGGGSGEMPFTVRLMRPGATEDEVSLSLGMHRRRVADMYYKNTAEEVEAEEREKVTSGIKDFRDWASKAIVEGFGSPASAEQILRRMWQLEREAEDYFRHWDALMERLEAVEQLYIAC